VSGVEQRVAAPAGLAVLVPGLEFESDGVFAGSAFVLRTDEHGLVFVTARHLMSGASGALKSMSLTTLDLDDVCSTETGIIPIGASAQRDVLIGVVTGVPERVRVFELSERGRPDKGEAVWVPVPNVESDFGVVWREGTVTSSRPGQPIRVSMSERHDFTGASGSPVISVRDGRVVGVLTGSAVFGKVAECVPASFVSEMLSAEGGRVGPLREIPALNE